MTPPADLADDVAAWAAAEGLDVDTAAALLARLDGLQLAPAPTSACRAERRREQFPRHPRPRRPDRAELLTRQPLAWGGREVDPVLVMLRCWAQDAHLRDQDNAAAAVIDALGVTAAVEEPTDDPGEPDDTGNPRPPPARLALTDTVLTAAPPHRRARTPHPA